MRIRSRMELRGTRRYQPGSRQRIRALLSVRESAPPQGRGKVSYICPRETRDQLMLRRSVPPVNNTQISNSGSLEANFHRALASCPIFSANPRRVVQSLVGKSAQAVRTALR